MDTRTNNFHYAMIQALFWLTYCTGTNFISSCLLSIGYSNSQVGIVIALCGALSAVLQPLFAGIIDRSGKRLLKPVLFSAVVLAVLLSAVELICPENLIVMGVCYGINIVALQFVIPLMNSMSILSRRGYVDFGLGRAVGSLVFAVAAVIVGRLVTGYGMQVLAIVRMAGFTAFLLCAMLFPIRMEEPINRTREREPGFFQRNTGFLAVVIGCVFVYLCQTLTSFFGYQVIVSKGGNNTSLGIALGIAALVEVPVMLVFSRLIRWKPASFWFMLSGFGYAAKAFCFLVVPNVPLYYAAQLAQMIGWPLMQVASVRYVASVTTDSDATRGQAYITLTYSIAIMAGSAAGGYIIEHLGVPVMLVISVCCSLIGGAVITAGIKKRERADRTFSQQDGKQER